MYFNIIRKYIKFKITGNQTLTFKILILMIYIIIGIGEIPIILFTHTADRR